MFAQYSLLWAAALTWSCLVAGLSFELQAQHADSVVNLRCFSIYIGKDVLTVGKYSIVHGPHQEVLLEVTDSQGSVLYSKKNANGSKQKFVFTTHGYSDYTTCFKNILEPGIAPNPSLVATITFDLSIGPEAADPKEISSAQEHLKPIEQQLIVLEQAMEGILDEMEYLTQREASMRDTNESTNERVQYLSLLSMGTLILSGVWQIFYLKQFFESKKIL